MSNHAPPNSKTSILLVDDDRLILSTLTTGLESAGYEINTAESVDEAEQWLEHNPRPDLVLLDYSMPNKPGTELAPKLKALNNIPFIMLTAYSEKETVEEVTKAGALSYLVKPVSITQVIPAINTALGRDADLKHLKKSSEMLQTALDGDRAVSVAIGIVMEKHKLSNNEAFESIRRHARSNHLKLIDVAHEIIDATETLTKILSHKKANAR